MWVHRLTEKNLSSRTAVCAVCGPTKIKVRGDGRSTCYTKHKENKGKKYNPKSVRTKQTASGKEKTEFVRKVKNVPCTDCGVRYPFYIMEFDHREPSKKSFEVSRYANKTIEAIIEEIAKCDLLCANCHRERTHGKRHPNFAPTLEG